MVSNLSSHERTGQSVDRGNVSHLSGAAAQDTLGVSMKHAEQIDLSANGLDITCFFSPQGKLLRKMERRTGGVDEYQYTFDHAGHLLNAACNGVLEESYRYNTKGQRVQQERRRFGTTDVTSGVLEYDARGQLVKAGQVAYSYDTHGSLAQRKSGSEVTRYTYGDDTMPDTVVLPSGEEIRYEYEASNPVCPVRRYKNNELTTEYVWANPLQLTHWYDHIARLAYTLGYGREGQLDRVRIAPMPPATQELPYGIDYAERSTNWLEARAARKRNERVHSLLQRQENAGTPARKNRNAAEPVETLLAGGTRNRQQPVSCKPQSKPVQNNDPVLELLCGCDQVGTPKLLTNKSGTPIKEMVYDSFGNLRYDTLPDLFLPIGFAGGLVDHDTGFVRFGYRDYDPEVGRFTAKDPLGDTGGDHDQWDYCVDDPVGSVDKTGLLNWKKFVGRSIGTKIAGMGFMDFFFPEEVNADEKVVSLANEKAQLDKKVIEGTATKKDIQRIGQIVDEDEAMRKKHAQTITPDDPFFKNYPPLTSHLQRKE